MTENEIKSKVNKAISDSVPDVFDSILERCKHEEGKVIKMTENKNTNRWMSSVMGIAAAIVIILAGFSGLILYRNNAVDSVIALDVNPSIELSINKKERVVDVIANNADAKTVLGTMDLEGSDLDVAVNAIVGAMLREGYIDELANSILISVDNKDPEKSAALQKRLSDEINSLLNTESFQGAVLSQSLSHDPETQQIAEQYGITEGKAQLISVITKADSRYTAKQLAELSINELNLLASSGQELSGTVEATGSASEKQYIGAEKAKEKALAHAGIAENEIFDFDCELDYENGTMVYEIEFDTSKTEYEYDINAVTGEIVKNKGGQGNNTQPTVTAPSTNEQPSDSAEIIGKDKAKEIALANAGVNATDIYDYSIELDNDDGVTHYEVEFDSGRVEYSYDIEAYTGEILKSEKDLDD